MGRRWAIVLTVVLLLGAGLTFALLGFRALRFERSDAERAARDRAEHALGEAVVEASERAREPRGEPVASWRLAEPVPGPPPEEVSEDQRLLLKEAAYREAIEAERGRALDLWRRLATEQGPAWLHQVASLRGGMLARRMGDPAAARTLLGAAATAPPSLLDADGVYVRLAALYHLAALDLEAGRHGAVLSFLDEAEDGGRLAAGPAPNAGDLVLALAALLPSEGAAGEEPAAVLRLRAAARRAALGQRILAALPRDGHAYAAGRLAWRRGPLLQLRDVAVLLDPASPALVASIDVLPASSDESLGPLEARLAPPLQGLIIRVRPQPPAAGDLAVLALVAGLLVYALGCGLALTALRRSLKAARMQADFVAAVSHELKTPIASVRAMAEFMADGGVQDPERAHTYAERIEGEMTRLGATVRNVLDAARIERLGSLPVALQPDDPARVVEEVGAAFQPTLERRGFRFAWEAEPAAKPLNLDREALKGVLMNLVDNAAKFSEERKEIEVRGAPRDARGGYAIEVLDRGRGIAARDRQRLFERFFRGDAAKAGAVPGVGLGLHVARQVVQAHGGTLQARSREGGGSVFRLELEGDEA